MTARTPRPSPLAPRWARLPRWTRLARLAVLTPVLALAAGCGDDDDATGSGGDISGTYALTQVNGSAVPFQGVRSGTVVFDDGDFQFVIQTTGGSISDTGTYERDGNQVNFSSDEGDEYSGTLSSRNRVLTIADDEVSLRFERD